MMKKSTKIILIAAVTIVTLAASTVVAFAATGTSNIEDLFYAFRSAQTEEAVANGDMTQDEADQYLGNLLDQMQADDKDAVPPLRGYGNAFGQMGNMPYGNVIELYAGISGQDADAIRDALCSSDTTIYAMADESGDLDALKAAMLEDAVTRIDELVDADRIDAERAAALKADVTESINTITADTQMDRGPKGGQMGGRQMGGRGTGLKAGGTCENLCES